MFRCAVLYAFCAFFSLSSVTQTLRDKVEEPHLAVSDLHAGNSLVVTTGNARISITRLREPHKARKIYNKAFTAWVKGRPEEALRILDCALRIYPTFPEALALYGGIQASLQHWESAEQKLLASIQTDPTYSPPYVILAGVYNTEDRFDEAQQVIQQALSAGDDSWHLQYEIARSLIGKREYESALATSEGALRSTPDQGLGLRKYPQAAEELTAYLRYEPSGNGSVETRDLLQRVQRIVSQ